MSDEKAIPSETINKPGWTSCSQQQHGATCRRFACIVDFQDGRNTGYEATCQNLHGQLRALWAQDTPPDFLKQHHSRISSLQQSLHHCIHSWKRNSVLRSTELSSYTEPCATEPARLHARALLSTFHDSALHLTAVWHRAFTTASQLSAHPPAAAPHGGAATMASPFSGVLQLTDLDDYIGPSQVGARGANQRPENRGASPNLLKDTGRARELLGDKASRSCGNRTRSRKAHKQ